MNHLAYSSFIAWGSRVSHRISTFGWERSEPYRKVGHVSDEDIDLDNLGDGRATLLKNGLQVLDAGSSLLLEGALDQVALGIAGDLTRAVEGGLGLDGLRLHVVRG